MTKRTFFSLALSVAILGGAGLTVKILMGSTPTAARDAPVTSTPHVEIVVATSHALPAHVQGSGTVTPARTVTVAAQVSGEVIRQSEKLVLGGRFKAGETLLRIDPRDYTLTIRERRSQVEKATLELELEKARGKVAEHEWQLLGKNKPAGESSSLALREPHLENARVALASARGALDRAKLNKSRTKLIAPFNATVTAETVETGQFIAQGSPIATLIGTDQFWAKIALPVASLEQIVIPEAGGKVSDARPSLGSPATITQMLPDNRTSTHVGRVLRLVGELDPQTRMAQVLIAIDNPLDPDEGQLPLLPGAFVTAQIEGKVLSNTLRIPRRSLVGGHNVWVVDDQNTLRSHRIEILWSDKNHLWVSSGIEDGDRIVTTKVPEIEGMLVQVQNRSDLIVEKG